MVEYSNTLVGIGQILICLEINFRSSDYLQFILRFDTEVLLKSEKYYLGSWTKFFPSFNPALSS